MTDAREQLEVEYNVYVQLYAAMMNEQMQRTQLKKKSHNQVLDGNNKKPTSPPASWIFYLFIHFILMYVDSPAALCLSREALYGKGAQERGS